MNDHDPLCNYGVDFRNICDCDLIAKARAEECLKWKSQRLVEAIFHAPDSGARPFVLRRLADVSGISGAGIVAHGVEFPDGTVALRWVGSNPTSVVFHDNGIQSVEAIHGHNGSTQIVWTSEDFGERAAEIEEAIAAAICAVRGES